MFTSAYEKLYQQARFGYSFDNMTKFLNQDLIFKNREHAGNLLAKELEKYSFESPVVIGLVRGGVPVAKPIAEKLKGTLDIMASKKIGAPNNPELAIGAVTSFGDYVISSYSDYEPGDKKSEYLHNQIGYLVNESKEKEKKYRMGLFQVPSYQGQNIILVDDGIATGMTMFAAVKSIKKQNPKSVIVAVPVISEQAYEEMKKHIKLIKALKIPSDFVAVGIHYKSFEAVTDEEIISMLALNKSN